MQPLVDSLQQIRDYKGEFKMDDVDLKVNIKVLLRQRLFR